MKKRPKTDLEQALEAIEDACRRAALTALRGREALDAGDADEALAMLNESADEAEGAKVARFEYRRKARRHEEAVRLLGRRNIEQPAPDGSQEQPSATPGEIETMLNLIRAAQAWKAARRDLDLEGLTRACEALVQATDAAAAAWGLEEGAAPGRACDVCGYGPCRGTDVQPHGAAGLHQCRDCREIGPPTAADIF